MTKINLSKSVVFITGAAGQLGQVLIKELLMSNAKVVAVDNSEEKLEELVSKNNFDESNITIIKADVKNIIEVQNAFEKGIKLYGYINGLINNAAISIFDSWQTRKESEFDLVTQVNLKGSFNCMKEFFNYLIKTKREGSVVNVASHYGIISPNPTIYTDCNRKNSEVYGATKAGLIQMTKYFAINAIIDGAKVRVNAIAPGGIRNPDDPQGADFQKRYSSLCPMGRMGEQEEIVGPVLFLLSSMSSYINGHTLVIDGGMTSW